jgi:hypothetical protein
MSLHNECGFTGYRANGGFTVAMTGSLHSKIKTALRIKTLTLFALRIKFGYRFAVSGECFYGLL